VIAAWMIQASLTAVLLGAAAWACEELCRVAGLPRRGVWVAALLGTVLLPVWLATSSGGSVPVPVGDLAVLEGAAAADVALAATGGRSGLGAARGAVGAVAGRVAVAVGRAATEPVERFLTAGWLLLSLVFGGGLAWTMIGMADARRGWLRWRMAGETVYVAARTGPAVVGLLRPAIVVPVWLLTASGDRQRMTVLHEREHIRAGDPLLLALSYLVMTLMPWNPGVHWLVRRLRVAVELDCDRRVLSHGVPAGTYGSMLVQVAGHAERVPLALAGLIASPSDLERRIVAMTAGLPTFRFLRALTAGALASVLVLAACDLDMVDPALRDLTIGDAVTGAAAASPALASVTLNARYVLDGMAVTLDEIRDLGVADIATAELVRADATGTGAAEVRLTTKSATQVLSASREAAAAAAVIVRGGRVAAVATPIDSGAGIRVRGGVAITSGAPVEVISVRGARAERARLRAVQVDSGVVPLGTAVQSGVAIRGASLSATSILAAGPNRPLLIIDGVIVTGKVDLDPALITSIEVVKGAAAARLYGERGKNGVILITTRK
jgi:bla regulator protein blaR1